MASNEQGTTSIALENEAAMVAFGRRLISILPDRLLVTLSGELGAGKSLLARSMIEALGVTGRIKSPSYTLLETYQATDKRIAHLDLYRLEDPDELQYLGFDDVLAENDLIFIEWPEKADEQLRNVGPSISVWQVHIAYADNGRVINIGGPGAVSIPGVIPI